MSILRNVHSHTFLIIALSIEFGCDRWTIDRNRKKLNILMDFDFLGILPLSFKNVSYEQEKHVKLIILESNIAKCIV